MIGNKNAIITGITGQDGSYLTKLLLEKNYRVFGVLSGHNKEDQFKNFEKLKINPKDIEFIEVEDISNFEEGEIYNFAAISSVGYSWNNPYETFEANVLFYIKLLEQCKNKNFKILNASSVEMFGNHDQKISERTPLNPQNPYALSKFTSYKYGQILRESYNMWITNAIFSNHESILRDNRFVTRKIIDTVKNIKQGNAKFLELGNINIKRDWGFADEYVEASYKLVQEKEPLDIIVATGHTIELKEFIRYVFNYFQIDDYEKYIKINSDLIRGTDINEISLDISKLKSLGIDLEGINEKNIFKLIS